MEFIILLIKGKCYVYFSFNMGDKNVLYVSGTAAFVQRPSDYSPLEQNRQICPDLPECVVALHVTQ